MESPPATPASPQLANRFGKYTLVARLATGGMAEIFLARLQGAAGFEKLLCIKRILPHLARDRQFVSMFLDEARIAARISHPNVCQVFELGEIEGSYYLAMEYLEGVPLACFRRDDYYGAAPDPRLVAGIAVQACEGLHHAHQLRHGDGSVMEVVHRDISPQNLFVTSDGIVKVLDFGIAKIQGATMRTSTGALKGTYAYMAPEQLRSERVDRRTDVFALGIVMWEILARRHLFKRDTEFLTFQAITAEPIEDICALRPDVPPALSAVIMTALARDRDERFPTARMLGEAVAAAVQPLTGSAISEELARAFPRELAEQAELIRVAREGGSFDLDVERGPSVGHGAELLTTPVSNQLAAEPPQTISGPHVVSGPYPTGPHAISGPHRVPGAPSGVIAAPPVTAAIPLRRSLRPLAIAALALGVGGGAAVIYGRVTREPARGGETDARAVVAGPEAPTPPTAPGGGSAVATANGGGSAAVGGGSAAVGGGSTAVGGGSTATANGGGSEAVGGGSAAVGDGSAAGSSAAASGGGAAATAGGSAATVSPGGGGSAAAAGGPPPNAAPSSAALKPAERRPVPASRPSAPPAAATAARPAGPPGYITIDSSPVYAVIYIDGKSYGETPLVRVELSPGRHVVRAVAPSGASREVRITVEAGKVAPAARIVW